MFTKKPYRSNLTMKCASFANGGVPEIRKQRLSFPVRALDESLFSVRCCAVDVPINSNHGGAVCGDGSVLPIFHIKNRF